jgi:hypothetical protein
MHNLDPSLYIRSFRLIELRKQIDDVVDLDGNLLEFPLASPDVQIDNLRIVEAVNNPSTASVTLSEPSTNVESSRRALNTD